MLSDLLTPLDFAALAWFFLCWLGYSRFADHGERRERSMTAVMGGYRRQWMMAMLRRDNRILDSQILGNLLTGASFFASTTIFAIGGLVALLGASDQATAVLAELPLVARTSPVLWDLKVLLLLGIMVFAFFKFSWGFRLFNHCSVLVGAVPPEIEPTPEAVALAEKAARINILASRHFNRGLRAYFFALAALTWFLHPVLLVVAATWVVIVLYRRDFHSRSLKIVSAD